MTHAWIHVSEGTEITAYTFDSLDDAVAFRAVYADDDDANGARKDVDDIPELPDGERDNQETDTWILVAGQVDAVEGIEPGHFHRVGEGFVEQPVDTSSLLT